MVRLRHRDTAPGHYVVASPLGILPNVTGFIVEDFDVRCIHRTEARNPTEDHAVLLLLTDQAGG